MHVLTSRIKKLIALVTAAITISLLCFSPLRAQTSQTAEQYLAQIADNTYNILKAVNDVPVYLASLPAFLASWLAPDESKTTPQLQTDLANYGNRIVQDINVQNSLQPQLLAELFGQEVTRKNMPNANDMVYSTLLGIPYFDPDPRNPAGAKPTANPPYNYIKNASGMLLSHTMPQIGWTGKSEDQLKYLNFYNTVMSVESFNAYALSGLYAEYVNGGSLTPLQSSLITKASNSDWFVEISSEPLGVVLRQILLYQSQIFMLMTQLIHTEKQLLTTQVMSNSLLILMNQTNEQMLLQKAISQTPTL